MKYRKDIDRLSQTINAMMYIFYQIENGDEEMARAFNEYLDELDARSNSSCDDCQTREN